MTLSGSVISMEIDSWLAENLNYRLTSKKPGGKLDITDSEIKDILPVEIYFFMAIHNQRILSNHNDIPEVKMGRSYRFLKYCNHFNLNNTYLINFCDAMGWEYDKLDPILSDHPVFQLSRRKSQRDSVVLWPLAKRFMNISDFPVDKLCFEDKLDTIVWKGRISGTHADSWDPGSYNKMFWMEGIAQKPESVSEEYIRQVLDVTRYKAVYELHNKKHCNVSLTASHQEISNIERCELKKKYFAHLIGGGMTMQDQRKSKYILAVDGNCYPSSLYWSMLSNSVVFLVESQWETILDCNLKPWTHYVPVYPTHKDIMEKFEHMQSNPDKAKDIINNAHEHLAPYTNSMLRDRLDYLTLFHYESRSVIDPELSFTDSNLNIIS